MIKFDKNNAENSNINKNTTFQNTINDIKKLKQLNLINQGIATALIQVIKNSEKIYLNNNKRQAMQLIWVAEKLLEKAPDKLINNNAYKILIIDINALRNPLQT